VRARPDECARVRVRSVVARSSGNPHFCRWLRFFFHVTAQTERRHTRFCLDSKNRAIKERPHFFSVLSPFPLEHILIPPSLNHFAHFCLIRLDQLTFKSAQTPPVTLQKREQDMTPSADTEPHATAGGQDSKWSIHGKKKNNLRAMTLSSI